MSFVLAHLSDVHLGPVPPGSALRNFAFKRLVGGASWHFNRRHLHLPAVSAALRDDILAAKPDHVALTGDLVNIAAMAEFSAGAKWLRSFGQSAALSFVPGNHDAYVAVKWEHGLGHLAKYMVGDMAVDNAVTTAAAATPFPFVRLRRNVALIGLNSACPQPLHKAGGRLGHQQLAALAETLKTLRERGFYRVVMLHHPPMPGQAPKAKELADARALTEIITDHGAELVLHGHIHLPMHETLSGRHGTTTVIGVPSASLGGDANHAPAAWNRYEINRYRGRWTTAVSIRRFDREAGKMIDADSYALSS